MNITGKKWLPYLVYALAALALLGPLLKPGYILVLDMLFGPHMDFSAEFYGLDESVSARIPLEIAIQLVSYIIPSWLLQKGILFLALFLAGLGAHKLLPLKGAGSYFAGLLYMINPFTYVRFMAGHLPLLLAYALIPFAIKAFLDLLENGGKRNAIKTALLTTLVGLVAIHGLFLLLLIFLIIFIIKAIKERNKLASFALLNRYVVLSAAIFLILNVYWLVPVLTAETDRLAEIGQQDLLIFAPKPGSGFGIMFDIASMQGFWRGEYLHVKDILPIWWLPFLLILFLAVFGFISKFKDTDNRWAVWSFGTLGIVGFILALGASTQLTRPLFEWLWEHVFFFPGFRDSQKFTVLICLAYAYLGGIGVSEIAKGMAQQRKRYMRSVIALLLVVAFLLIPMYSPNMFGFWGKTNTVDYPNEWYEVSDYLEQDTSEFNTLFLPWHGYMNFSWLPNQDKRLANPAYVFFDKPVIAGDTVDLPGIYSESTNPISKYVEVLLENANNTNNFGELVAPLNVKYVILIQEADVERYDFLYNQIDLSIEMDKPGITLFRNENITSKTYAVDGVIQIDSLEELIGLSEVQNIMEHVYVLGDEIDSSESTGIERLEFTEKNPVRYEVTGSEKKFTIFTLSHSANIENWEQDGKSPVAKNLGFIPVFESNDDGGEITYERFYWIYLPSYIVSGAAFLVVVLAFYWLQRLKKTN